MGSPGNGPLETHMQAYHGDTQECMWLLQLCLLKCRPVLAPNASMKALNMSHNLPLAVLADRSLLVQHLQSGFGFYKC